VPGKSRLYLANLKRQALQKAYRPTATHTFCHAAAQCALLEVVKEFWPSLPDVALRNTQL